MAFIDLLSYRRSKRKFKSNVIEADKIELLIASALVSPTGKKKNHWDFIVIREPETLQKLSLCKPYSASLIASAPLAIVVIGDPFVSDTWIEDCSIASIIIQLEAEDLGLGSCWVQVRNRVHESGQPSAEYIKKLLGIPSPKEVLSVIAIGYPDEQKKPNDLKNLIFEKIHYEKF